MEITQHARYTCTFCGKVSNIDQVSGFYSLIYARIGHGEAYGGWDLELQLVQKGHRRRCMDGIHHRGCYCSQVRQFLFLLIGWEY